MELATIYWPKQREYVMTFIIIILSFIFILTFISSHLVIHLVSSSNFVVPPHPCNQFYLNFTTNETHNVHVHVCVCAHICTCVREIETSILQKRMWWWNASLELPIAMICRHVSVEMFFGVQYYNLSHGIVIYCFISKTNSLNN